MRATYGFEGIGKNASLIHEAEQLIERLGVVNTPGQYLVNSFPFMRYIPEWAPGGRFKRELSQLWKLNKSVVDTPFGDAKVRIVSMP